MIAITDELLVEEKKDEQLSAAVNQSSNREEEKEAEADLIEARDQDSSDYSLLSSSSKRNRDIYGMLGDDPENQTDMMCEE